MDGWMLDAGWMDGCWMDGWIKLGFPPKKRNEEIRRTPILGIHRFAQKVRFSNGFGHNSALVPWFDVILK